MINYLFACAVPVCTRQHLYASFKLDVVNGFVNRNLSLYLTHLILLDFGAIGSCVENFVVFKLRQSLKAEYHDGEEDDEHGDDGDDAGVLAGLGILEQQPHPPLEIIGWKWFLLLFDKTFIFPANKKDKQYTQSALLLNRSAEYT